MKARVETADARFKALLIPGVEIGDSQWPWWHRGVLARSSDEYAEDMARLNGIEVQLANPGFPGDRPIRR